MEESQARARHAKPDPGGTMEDSGPVQRTDGSHGDRGRAAQPDDIVPIDTSRSVLDKVAEFIGGCLYATPEQVDAITLACAVSHVTDALTTVPRVLVTSNDPGSGKSTILDLALMLCDGAWMADPTGPALKSKFKEGRPVTLILDEISKIFGESGFSGKGNPVYRPLVEGYRRNATFSFSAANVAYDVPCYGVAFLAGLRTAAPADIRSRSVEIVMRPKPGSLKLAGTLEPDIEAFGMELGKALHSWARSVSDEVRSAARKDLTAFHPKMTDRRRQVWGGMAAVAIADSPEWAKRARQAFISLALDSGERPYIDPLDQIVLDAGALAEETGSPYVFTRDLLDWCRTLEERPFYEEVGDDIRLARDWFPKALGKASQCWGEFAFRRDDDPEGPGNHQGRSAAAIIKAAEKVRQRISPDITLEEADDLSNYI